MEAIIDALLDEFLELQDVDDDYSKGYLEGIKTAISVVRTHELSHK
jgi:hypothetical protein